MWRGKLSYSTYMYAIKYNVDATLAVCDTKREEKPAIYYHQEAHIQKRKKYKSITNKLILSTQKVQR